MERQAVARVQHHRHRVKDHQPKPARSSTTARPLNSLQQSIGNQALQRLVQSPYIQTKLQVSTPGDRYAQEADRVESDATNVAQPEARAPFNGPVPMYTPGFAVAYGGGPKLHGKTNAKFDRGTREITKLKYSRATGCNCPGKQPCMKATATLVITYKAISKIVMPPMPRGLSQCKQDRVRRFFRDELGPHEKEHKRRFDTYNGTTEHEIEGLGCGQAEAKSELDDEARAIHRKEFPERERAARDLTGLDPYFEVVDFDGCK